MKKLQVLCVVLSALMLFCIAYAAAEEGNKEEQGEEKNKVHEETLTYAKGSVCGYCDYCKVLYCRSDSVNQSL